MPRWPPCADGRSGSSSGFNGRRVISVRRQRRSTELEYLQTALTSLRPDQTIEISEGSDTFNVILWATLKAAQR